MNKELSHKKIVVIVLAVVLAVAVPLSAYASIVLTSNHIKGNVNTVVLTITSNNTNVIQNDVLLLTAHINNTKSGISVQFFNGTTALNPTVLTDNSGNAQSLYNVTDSTAYDLYAVVTLP
jgi:hypothetical protein